MQFKWKQLPYAVTTTLVHDCSMHDLNMFRAARGQKQCAGSLSWVWPILFCAARHCARASRTCQFLRCACCVGSASHAKSDGKCTFTVSYPKCSRTPSAASTQLLPMGMHIFLTPILRTRRSPHTSWCSDIASTSQKVEQAPKLPPPSGIAWC